VLEYIRNLQRSTSKQDVKVILERGLLVDKQEKEADYENVSFDTMVDPRFKEFDYIDEESAEIELCVKTLKVKY
jgi:hypothetical protein